MTSAHKIQFLFNQYFQFFAVKVLAINFILVIIISLNNLYGQISDISEKDKELLQESEKIKEEAEQLQITANELYLEAAMLEQNENFVTDKKIQKEYKKNQQNAQKTELKAAERFEEANKIKIDIYQKYIEDFWKNFDGDESVLINARLIEETSKEYFVRASTSRDEAKRIENQTEKFLKLSEAYEYELIGIEKLQTAYDIYKNWPNLTDSDGKDDNIDFQISDTYIDDDYEEPETLTDTITQIETSQTESEFEIIEMDNAINAPVTTEIEVPVETTTYDIETTDQITNQTITDDNVQVNAGQINKILRYMEEDDSDTIYYLANEVNGFDMASIQKFWNNYRDIEYEDDTPPTLLAESEPESESITEKPNEEDLAIDTTTQDEETTENVVADKEVEIGKVTETVVPDPNSKIIYRIQIAAQQAPLSQAMLQRLFYANQKIAMVDEGGWFKYSIGEFETFSEANDFRKNLNRDDAFVVAYRDAINVQYVEQGETTEQQKETTAVVMAKQRPEIDSKDITFVVQIAASRDSMKESDIKRIYKGELPVNYRFEDNWHKYQIGNTNSYLEIKQTKETVDVNGAFIVAYHGNEKLKLWQAIRRVHSSNDQIMFVLQIAASKTQLSDEKINSIFSGNDHVIEIYEEGWFKYHIVCGNTYGAARRFKNLWGIRNSFIVAYKNNKKIDIREAIEKTSN